MQVCALSHPYEDITKLHFIRHVFLVVRIRDQLREEREITRKVVLFVCFCNQIFHTHLHYRLGWLWKANRRCKIFITFSIKRGNMSVVSWLAAADLGWTLDIVEPSFQIPVLHPYVIFWDERTFASTDILHNFDKQTYIKVLANTEGFESSTKTNACIQA